MPNMHYVKPRAWSCWLPFWGGWWGWVRVPLRLIDDLPSDGFCQRLNSLFLTLFAWFRPGLAIFFNGEFDPGSGRTLAACLTHASRTVRPLRGYTSGERVSNT